MRFLFTTIPGFGHFHPVVPIAAALRGAGHDVAFATAASFCPKVEAAGFTALPVGLDWDESRLLETLPEAATIAKQFQGDWMMRSIFLDRSPRQMAHGLATLLPQWRPDAVISGTYEFGGALAAERAGIPHVSCSISFRWTRWLLKQVAGRALSRLRRELHLPPDPHFTAFARYLDLSLVPPSWDLSRALLRPALNRRVRAKVFGRAASLRQRLAGTRALALRQLLALDQRRPRPDVGVTIFVRSFARASDRKAPPAWLAEMPDQPLIYVSLGTVFAAQYPQIFQTILDALRDEPVNLVLTIGSATDPAQFGAQPANVRIERFIAHDDLQPLLARADLCICHAGYGTVMDAIAHGLPLLLLPLAADQPVIAQMCYGEGLSPELPEQAWQLNGKGLPIIRPEAITPAMLRQVVRATLAAASFRQAAQALRDSLCALPDAEGVVPAIENVVNAHRATLQAGKV